ncbi:uncharacterized protein LOC121738332 [Aricia agestis]|uniref:uncharacterized protein LOC121738332 n=1 Tax=Aricia agestis TaxID=91739 RepID=UPI001C20768B|nr:uncharacterized protein LOC121738332 [Aricia agestis]
MESMGIPVDIINIFRYWYRNQTNHVKWANRLSRAYRLNCGVRQGGLSSPKLFNLYVNDLIVELSSMRVGCKVGGVSVNNISYADDMVLLSPTARGIREMLKVLTDDLKDDLDIERERRALAVRGNMLARRFARCTDEVKITLFKAFCQNLYTGGLWISYTKASLNTLRIQYNNIFRMMLKLPRFCSASEMFAQARTDGFRALMRKKAASLINRVRGSDNSILKIVADDPHAPILRNYVRIMNEFESRPPGYIRS